MRKTVHISAISIFLGVMLVLPQKAAYAQQTSTTLSRADTLFEAAREMEALDQYQQVLQQDSLHFKALWRTSLILAREGYRQEKGAEQESYYQESLDYAERTLRHYPDSGLTHFVYAVANGRISDISGSSKRIKLSHIVKKHAERATEMMPEYAPAWHLLGLWHSKVANVGSAQKMAAGLLSGNGLPEGASNAKAEQYIRKALALDPSQSIRYQLDLGRHYQRAGEPEKARKAFQTVLDEEAQNPYDRQNQAQARELLEGV